jgi:hypothetical protein
MTKYIHLFVINMELGSESCAQLFDIALSKGFTHIDSFQMLNADSETLQLAYDQMESSRNYTTQQLEYVSTMLSVRTIHEGLINSGELLSPFDRHDTRRYTMVLMQSESDDPLYCGQNIPFSEHGLKLEGGDPRMVTPDFLQIISNLSVGQHLIRYLNVPYSKRYRADMFVPVLLDDDKLSG